MNVTDAQWSIEPFLTPGPFSDAFSPLRDDHKPKRVSRHWTNSAVSVLLLDEELSPVANFWRRREFGTPATSSATRYIVNSSKYSWKFKDVRLNHPNVVKRNHVFAIHAF